MEHDVPSRAGYGNIVYIPTLKCIVITIHGVEAKNNLDQMIGELREAGTLSLFAWRPVERIGRGEW
jgi:hypothetical protein